MKPISFLLSILFSVTVYADYGVYKLPIVRDGLKKTRVAYNSWSGEYPGPVIKVVKKTTLQAVESVRTDKAKSVACTVDSGIYHMWSDKSPKALISFYTLTSYLEAKVVGSVDDEAIWNDDAQASEKSLMPGEKITHIYYGAEGWCGAKMKRNGGEANVSFSCDSVLDNPSFEMTSEDSEWNFYEQWLYLSCQEGHRVFIQDIEFLKQKNVVEGSIAGYGEVK